MLGADLNEEMIGPMGNDYDDHIGIAMWATERRPPATTTANNQEILRCMMKGAGLRLRNSHRSWWRTAES